MGSILITGANGGLGSATVSRIVSSPLGRDYYGIYTVRNPAKADSLNDILGRAAAQHHSHELVAVDLSSLASVRAAASDINKRVAQGTVPRIRTMVLNAAYQDTTSLHMTKDGFEITFQVNYLSHFLLTLLLLESMDPEHGRIVVIGSWSHDVTNPRNDVAAVAGAYKDLKELFTGTEGLAKGTWSTPAEDPSNLAGYRRYGASKLCEIMFLYELQERLDQDPALSNISVLGVDPGAMGTGLLRNSSWFLRNVAMKGVSMVVAPIATKLQPNGMLRTTGKSAADVLRAAFDTEALGEHPKATYLDGDQVQEPSEEARDARKRTVLWNDSVKYVELKDGDTVLTRWR